MTFDLSGFSQMVVPQSARAVVTVFPDRGGIFHFGLGIIAGLSPDPYRTALFAGFTGYEISKADQGMSWRMTGGKFIEFALGMTLAGVLKMAAK